MMTMGKLPDVVSREGLARRSQGAAGEGEGADQRP